MDVHQPSTSMPVPGCLQEVAATQPCPFSDVVPPLPLFSGTVPCRMVFTSPPPLNTCPNHLSILFLTMVRRSLDILICSSPTSTSFKIPDQTFFFKMAAKSGIGLAIFLSKPYAKTTRLMSTKPSTNSLLSTLLCISGFERFGW